MIACKIEDIRQFTSQLFVGTLFDSFLVREAQIVTFNTFHIDGRVRKEYYTDQELEERHIGELSAWESVKPVCFGLIKGKKLPGSFRIVFQLGADQTEAFLKQRQLPVRAEQISGLYLNIRYEEGSLYCVTGTSVNFFTMDKSLEQEWDGEVTELFRKNNIPVSMD
ncbi:MAG: hypothetical protein HFG75_07840 [Hungatella sp.]|nr:hypothetical protein [Hungatella sp.]